MDPILIALAGLMGAAGVALARQGLIARPAGLATLCGFVLGAALFAADVSARAWLGSRLFPFAAPAGGLILIASWLVLAAAALGASRGA